MSRLGLQYKSKREFSERTTSSVTDELPIFTDDGTEPELIDLAGIDAVGNLSTTIINKTLTDEDKYEFVDSTGGNITITLPTAVGRPKKLYRIVRLDASGNTITVDTTGSETLNGLATQTLDSQFDAFTILSNNINWFII